MDLSVVGVGIVAVASAAANVYQWWLKQGAERAASSASASASASAAAVSDSQKELYQQLKERLQEMQAELASLRTEQAQMREQLRERDGKIHALEMYVLDLQHTLHAHQIDPPPIRM